MIPNIDYMHEMYICELLESVAHPAGHEHVRPDVNTHDTNPAGLPVCPAEPHLLLF